ncbi:MAG: bifunctional adenosylcobinamide kinase/adenosylcobinamide-phosphate guanylyltransferase [Candidatus Scalindua rubra]|uniref:Adenosylcobinamide kinase n=1 Tax=Candidatus Scalindua brodae TaxID=237368 RepID=A0A0B0ECS8_9BACT|nr:MAG: adenosylcobinamide-phosphateguanylyltransferase [Candidatus Scalindua brodae]MBZ0109359.1 bifunctional adenosylcobinamide kinase/adenosylcobinamide-phosphate guanylyltransferase [Candidatus Scalindua rubra]
MPELTLIIGGTRSGKSAFATELAKEHKHVCYIATADSRKSSRISDSEMLERIQKHRKNRPAEWKTVEAPLELDKAISNLVGDIDVVLIDCITIYVTNMLLGSHEEEGDERIIDAINKLCSVCKNAPFHVIMVTNEVGCGVVPDNALSRRFRDIAGDVNQIIAREADNVYLVTAGIESKIK